MAFRVGQRWFSQAEPELGLGVITEVGARRVAIAFPGLEEQRVYAPDRAPLQRFAPEPGQVLNLEDGGSLTVEEITEDDGLRIYHGVDSTGTRREVAEALLGTELALDEADQRLLSAQVNKLSWYLLRHDLYRHLARHSRSPARGLIGGRIDLIPHQFAVAWRATRFGLPRTLLADEVGLGKTIEAGLIMHRCRALDWAHRMLIVVPDALQHQWLVELIRKFELAPTVMNEDQWQGLVEDDPLGNPFEQSQLVILPVSLLSRHTVQQQVSAADWDLMVLDEAHHWDPEGNDGTQQTLSQLVAEIPGVLLLTATPEQGGERAHFERLHTLAPEQYTNFDDWQRSEQTLNELGDAMALWLEGEAGDLTPLDPWLQQDTHARELAARVRAQPDDRAGVRRLAEHLIAVHGVGRAQFRNSRQEISGFPERRLHATALSLPERYDRTAPYPELDVEGWERHDPRVRWLTDLMRADRSRKIVVICHHAATARALDHHLNFHEGFATAAFHEGLGLIERDRAAAWFADPVDGAQALICSEIGSEGRNFQFSDTLILFDLPPHPDLLEQRIGRLDRIGQGDHIDIHVAPLEGHVSEYWFRWYHEALDAFSGVCTVGQEVLSESLGSTGTENPDLTGIEWFAEPLEDRIRRDADTARRLRSAAAHGRQRLLSWASCDSSEADWLLDAIADDTRNNNPQQWVVTAMERLGFEVDPVDDDLFQFAPGADQIPADFPLAEDGPVLVTFSRERAIQRDDIRLITWEHPLVDFLADTLNQLHLGRAGVTLIQLPNVEPGRLFLEALYRPVMHHPAATRAEPHIDIEPLRMVVDETGRDLSSLFSSVNWRDLERPLERRTLLAIINTQQDAIRRLVSSAEAAAEPIMEARQQAAIDHVAETGREEMMRLDSLPMRDPDSLSAVRSAIEGEYRVRREALQHVQAHLDSVRLIVTG